MMFTSTISQHLRGSALRVISRVPMAAGEKDPKIVSNSVKSIAVLNAPKGVASAPILESVAIFSVRAAALDLNRATVS